MNRRFQPNIFVSIFLLADLTLFIPALSSAAGDAHAVQHLHDNSSLPRSDAQNRSEGAAGQQPTNVQLANEARCQQLLQNPQLDVLESGAFEPWFFLMSRVYHSSDIYQSPKHSLFIPMISVP